MSNYTMIDDKEWIMNEMIEWVRDNTTFYINKISLRKKGGNKVKDITNMKKRTDSNIIIPRIKIKPINYNLSPLESAFQNRDDAARRKDWTEVGRQEKIISLLEKE